MLSPRSGSLERRLRRIEGLLLLCVAALLIAGAFSEIVAKGRSADSSIGSASTHDLNTMTVADLSVALGISERDAGQIVEVRTRRGPLGDVDSLYRLRGLDGSPLLPPGHTGNGESDLVVRNWGDAKRSILLAAGAILLFLFVAHVLTRRLQPRADPVLLPIACVLAVLGVLALVSLKDPLRDMPAFWSQSLGIAVGGAMALGLGLAPRLHALPLHRYGYVYALAAVAATVVLGTAGVGPGGSGVRLSVAGIQPIEFIKVLLVFFLAAYLADRGPLLHDPARRAGPRMLPRRKDVAPLVVLYSLPLALFALVRDMGPVLLLFGTFLLMVYLATGRGGYVALGLAILLIGGFLGYRLQYGVFHTRVDMWISPWSNQHRSGEHVALGLWGLASGGPLGSGLGLGGTRFIPRGGSDLVFPALGEELGLPGTLLVSFCFLVIAARGIGIARRAISDFDRYLASGLSGLTALQAFVIMSGTLGILPLTGITLPFVAYGKSSLLASFFTIGLLLALSARANTAATAGSAVFPIPAVFRPASARAGALFAILIGVVIPLRLIWVQALAADGLAVRRASMPDADGVVRSHVNPRILAVAASISRGRILDRAGRTLAETRDGQRVYPFGASAAHVVGYLDAALGGPTGFEAAFAPQLLGYANIDALLPVWRQKDLPGFHYPRGQDVVTSIDGSLQQSAYDALVAGTSHLRDRRSGTAKRRGAAVILDVQTGQILAAASLPSFDPGHMTPDAFQRLRADVAGESPLFNRAASGYYAPGSTLKVAVASTMFANNDADFTFVCQHVDRNVIWSADGQTYARRAIVDDESDQPHGLVNLSGAISVSCNVYFAHAALLLGPQNLHSGLAAFGFSRLPTETQFAAELPDIGYGQGPMLATPLEMAGVAQTIGNGGVRMRPQFLKTAAPEVVARPLTAADAARIAEAMQRVTITGTAAGLFDGFPYAVAGKTGTAQNHSGDGAPHSWFIGFAPANHPRVAFAVLVENGGYGAQVAAPIAKAILQQIRLPS